MENIKKIAFLFLTAAVFCSFSATTVSAQSAITANAGPDVYLSSSQTTTTLQGSGYDPNGYALNYSWTCNGGTLSNYNIAQPIYTSPNIYNTQTTYTCTLTVTNNYGNSNSDTLTVYINYNNNGYYGNGGLIVDKKVLNLSSGNLNWQSAVYAKPSDILSFAITLQPNGQDVHNVVLRDILPANLIYKGNLTVNLNSNYTGNITSGINIGTVYSNQAVVVAYRAQIASMENFNYGTTTITNNTAITSNEGGTQNASSTVIVNRSFVSGASTISTGISNNILTDSFFLQLMLVIVGSWLYFTGRIYQFADWLKTKI